MSRRRPVSNQGQPSRDRDSNDDFPPLPIPRVPSLPTLNSPFDYSTMAPSPNRIPRWSTSTARTDRERDRERNLRRLDEISGATSFSDMISSGDHPWAIAARRHIEEASPGYSGTPREAFERLSEGTNALRELLDAHRARRNEGSRYQPPYYPPVRSAEAPEEARRSKRRKFDATRSSSAYNVMRYGQHGQVDPAQLHMEMVSCDGGMFSNELSYSADNILKDDNSVYCTKGNRCNIILRHAGSTVFTLTELVIKAPGAMNYSHPVREGMVFISMDQDDLLRRTAQYQIQYPPRDRSRPHHHQSSSSRPPPIISIRHYSDGTTTTRTRNSRVYFDDDDHRDPQMPPEFYTNQPDLNVITECSGDEEEPPPFPSDRGGFPIYRGPGIPPDRIGSLPFEDDSDSHSDEEDLSLRSLGSEDGFHRLRRVRPHRGTSTPLAGDAAVATGSNSISLNEAWDAHAQATQEAVRAVGGGDLLAPHARFFIEKKKNKCTLRFDPPVSGRFILLKMWSSRHDPGSNIDIQTVVARGYHGPRYFPNVEVR